MAQDILKFLWGEDKLIPKNVNRPKQPLITKEPKDMKICFVDSGNYTGMAQRLARDCGELYYFTQWEEQSTGLNRIAIGLGFDNIIKIKDIFEVSDIYDYHKMDLFVFPDTDNSWTQQHLIELGYNVWGSRHGEDIELYRFQAKELMKELKMPVSGGGYTYKRIVGIDNLIDYLKDKESQYIKVSSYRGMAKGMGETWKYQNAELSGNKLVELKSRLGILGGHTEFIVETELKSVCETGFDWIFSGGQFANKGSIGYEIKDFCYVAKFLDFKEVPNPIKYGMDKIAETLTQYGYEGFIHNEIRISEKKGNVPFITDWTCRSGSPGGEPLYENIENLPEVMYGAAQDYSVPIKMKHKYGVQAHIVSLWYEKHEVKLIIPDEVKDMVSLKNAVCIDKEVVCLPQQEFEPAEASICATVCGFGETLEEAIKDCKKNAEGIEGTDIEVTTDKLDKAMDEIAKGEKVGIKF